MYDRASNGHGHRASNRSSYFNGDKIGHKRNIMKIFFNYIKIFNDRTMLNKTIFIPIKKHAEGAYVPKVEFDFS